jgi:hypothetical protein
LLERGLLDAAHGVDDLQLRVSARKEKPKPNRKKHAAAEEEEESEDESGNMEVEEVLDEKPEEFIMRVNLYVAVHLSRASSSKRDHYKDALVFQTRKDLINEFLKSTLLNKCQNGNCGW